LKKIFGGALSEGGDFDEPFEHKRRWRRVGFGSDEDTKFGQLGIERVEEIFEVWRFRVNGASACEFYRNEFLKVHCWILRSEYENSMGS